MQTDALDTLVNELQKNGYFEHKKMSQETRSEFEKVHEHLDKIEKSKVSWKTYIAIGVGVLGYITALMGVIWSEIKSTNDNVTSFNSSVYELKIESFKTNQRLENVEKQQSLINNILNSK